VSSNHIIDLLLAGAERAPDALAYIFPGDGNEERRLTRAQLCERVRRIAANLLRRCAPGDRVALQLPQDEGYVTVFWACLYAGLVPVPLYPSANADVRRRLAGIVADSGARIAVCAAAGDDGQVGLADLLADAAPAAPACIEPATLAYLQYSSGSTGAPKGVMISHANIMANLAMLAESAAVRADDVFVNWLPLHHDLGLVNTVLLPVATGSLSVIGTPLSFMRNPMSWLTRMARYGGTVSGGPNFAYQLVVDRLRSRGGRGAAALAELDLRRWRVAFNAAEPIQTSTLEAFAAAFAPVGFAQEAFFAAYGLAEATVFVCGAPWSSQREAATRAGQAGAAQLAGTIACGPVDGRRLLVVDAAGQPAPPGAEGEIWIRGAHVAAGYFGRADEAGSPFRRFTAAGEGPYFATGDSGVVENGQLYVLGRIKDMLIQNGRNIYPTDVEQVVKGVLADAAGYADFAVVGKRQDGTEAIVLVLEARPQTQVDDPELLGRIGARVFEEQGVLLETIVVVPQGSITRTSSGKVRRQALRQALEAGELPVRGFQPQALPVADAPPADPALEAQLADLLSALTGQAVDDPLRSFFAYGISSLQITQLVAELAGRFQVELAVSDVFAHASVRRLGNLISAGRPVPAPPAATAQDGAALSANQQMLLAIDAWTPANPAYHLPLVLGLPGDVDPGRLARGAARELMRHEILRTVYVVQPDGRHRATVLDPSGFALDVEHVAPADVPVRLHALACQPFDLGAAYPVRGTVLVPTDGAEVVLALVVHHIAADGWSLRLLAERILACCGVEDAPADGPAVPFVVRPVAAEGYQAALAYWKDHLAGLPDVHSLPLDAARSGARALACGRGPASGRHEIRLAPPVVDALAALCAAQDATLFSGVHAVLALALARTGNQADIVLGTFLSGRDSAERLAQVGFLARTTLLRTALDLEADIAGLVRQCRTVLRDAQAHPDVSYLDLLRELKPVRDPGYNPLFQISLNYHDYGVAGLRAGGRPVRVHAVDAGVARYDLSVDAHPEAGGLRLSFEYDRTLFEPDTIARLAASFEALLAGALATPATPVGRLPAQAAPVRLPAPAGDVSLYTRFCAVADAAPDAVAVRYQGQGLSYRELSAAADGLAARIARHAAAGDRVLIFMRRTPAYVAAILAILKLDCTYVPLDPDYYQDAVADRIRFIAPACVLVDGDTEPELAGLGVAVPLIDAARAPAGEAAPTAVPHGRHPAYILFTSGSTGSPKAVCMGHAALDNLIADIGGTLEHAAPIVLNYSSIAFDMHFTEVFTALLHGGTVVLADAAMRRNTLALLGLIAEESVTVLNLSYPVLCELALGADQAGVQLPALRMVLSTAQQLKITPGLRDFFARHPAARLFNHYGPTETHVVTVAALGNAPVDWPDVPDIGKPIRNTACFVMNASGVPEAPGAIGELYVAGVPLAEGYYANHAMTAERFVHVDVGAGRLVRAYRTGDFVRIRNDGSLQYFGRKDHEIKIRGLRVDLSDIEASIQRCAGVAQAVVIARPLGGGMRILAWIQPEGGVALSGEDIAAELRRTLPAYMVPDRFVLVESFPLNQNAKIDVARLPMPAEPAQEQDEPVRSEHEAVVQEIWRKVLGHDGFGRKTSFFEAGGDSLALMAVKRELDLRYGRDIDLVAIYGSPSIAALADLVTGAQEAPRTTLRPRINLNTVRRQRLAAPRTGPGDAARGE
jgi:amino acid adenylation domain-containing protein